MSAALTAFDTATLYEAAGQRGAMRPELSAVSGDMRVAGPALTVLTQPDDNLALHHAVVLAEPGEIIVAQCHDGVTGGWGEVLTVAAMSRGVAGLVVDGAVRDVDAIRELGFPVFARRSSIRAAIKERSGHLRVPISCGGQLVVSGDYVVADVSGVVVIAAGEIEAVLAAARDRVEKERAMMRALRGGSTTVELLGLQAPPDAAAPDGIARA